MATLADSEAFADEFRKGQNSFLSRRRRRDGASPALTRVKVDCGEAYSNDTGSGDVTLRVPENAGCELRADQGRGDVRIEPLK